MKRKLLHGLSAAILAIASTTASAQAVDPLSVQVPGSDPASEPCTPTQRTDEYGTSHFNDDVRQSAGKSFDAVLFGDSITDFWVYSNLSFDGNASKTINMGIGSDRVQHLLWRVRNGALDGYETEYFTLLIGVNNGYQKHVDNHSDPCDRAEDVAEGIRLILKEMVAKHPQAKILLMPILPYGFDSRYYPGLDVRTVNEDVNDIIIHFVDYKNVFWVDLRGQYLNPDATCKASVFGGPGGSYDAPGHYLHPHTDSYPAIWKPALTNAMAKYHDADGGLPHVAEPSVGYASAAQFGYDHAATITVCGILTGTDANAVPVDTYSISYRLDGGPWTVALQDQGRSLTRASFTIPDVAPGAHTCQVKVTTADGKVLDTAVDFTMHDGWTGAPLPSDESSIRTDGTLVCAYACGAYTVNGVPFARANGSIDDENISWPFGATSGSQAPSGVASGDYRELLNHCWWANAGEKAVTLKNLAPGHDYLVQIFGYRNYDSYDKAHVWIKESYRDANYMKILGEGWTCGGALTGVFTATGTTKTITVCGDNNWAVNGIQVRDLGESGAPIVVPPSIGTVSVTTDETAASFFLSGIVMGTDDAGTNATSYSVSYRLGDAAAVAALAGQTGATASFAIENLADGDYACEVTITTDKNKTAAKSVSFTIGTPGQGGGGGGGGEGPIVPVADGWTAVPMGATSASIRTDGTLLYAYARGDYTANGVAFTGVGNGIVNTSNCVVWEASGGAQTVNPTVPSGTESGGYADLLGHGWWATAKGRKIKLNNLVGGKTYLVQIIAFRHDYTTQTATAPDGEQTIRFGGTGWEYGGSLVGVFTAGGTSEEFTIQYSGQAVINAIQVRELPEGGGGFQDWPADPDTEITDATAPADLGLTGGAFAEAATTTADLRKLAKWASANGVAFGGADVNAMSFDADGNPETALTAAYLLNCAVAGLDEAKAAFRFEGIVPGTVPTIDGAGYNGTVTVYGAEWLSGPWQPATDRHHFYRATLSR